MPDEPKDERPRREFLKTVVYAAPLILTLRAEAAFASYGSGNATLAATRAEGERSRGGEADHFRSMGKPYTHTWAKARGRNR